MLENHPSRNAVALKACQDGVDCSQNPDAFGAIDIAAPSKMLRKSSRRRRRRRRRHTSRGGNEDVRPDRRRRRSKSRRRRRRTKTPSAPAPSPPTHPAPVPVPAPPPKPEPTKGPLPAPSPEPVPTKAPAPAPGPVFRHRCTSTKLWDGSVMKFAQGTSFCDCNRDSNCSFICAGGKPNQAGQCGKAACREGIYTFDEANTWTIHVKKAEASGHYHAFAYLAWKNLPGGVTLKFSFKSIGHNTVYTKIFTLGKHAPMVKEIYGLLPPKSPGGSSTLCFMPLIPSWTKPACIGYNTVKDNTWYRVELMFNPPRQVASSQDGDAAGKVTLSVDGKHVGAGKIQGNVFNVLAGSLDEMSRIGVEHKGNPESYKFLFRDMCLQSL